MKRFLFALTLIAFSAAAWASPYYIGTDLGYSDTNYSSDQLGADDGTTGLGYRFFGGYEMNQNFSVELGWTHYAAANGDFVRSLDEHAYDTSFVGRLPLWGTGLSLFGKVGLAYLQAEKNFAGVGQSYVNTIRPAYGVGISNVLLPHLYLTTQWWRVQGKGDAFNGVNVDNKLPDADLYTVGLIYQFV